MVGRGEMTEEAWSVIAPLLPARGGRPGGQWRDHRTVINGILWKLRTGAPWRDLPERYGPWQTCADRLYRWRRDGIWDRILAQVQTRSDAVGEVVWEVSIDSTTARPPACQWRPPSAESCRRKKGVQHPADEGLGRSRGGLTTKVHLACDGKGRPLAVVITPGHRHDSTQLETIPAGIRVRRPGGRGRPRTRPERVIADKGYSYLRCRRLLRQRQIPHTIPERRDQRARRARQTSDDDLAAQFMHDAEMLNDAVHALEKEFVEAMEQLDIFNAGNAWIQSVLNRIYVHATSDAGDEAAGAVLDAVYPRKSPTVEDVRHLPYEERRLLLAATGMQVVIYPVGWREDGKRIDIRFDMGDEIMTRAT